MATYDTDSLGLSVGVGTNPANYPVDTTVLRDSINTRLQSLMGRLDTLETETGWEPVDIFYNGCSGLDDLAVKQVGTMRFLQGRLNVPNVGGAPKGVFSVKAVNGPSRTLYFQGQAGGGPPVPKIRLYILTKIDMRYMLFISKEIDAR